MRLLSIAVFLSVLSVSTLASAQLQLGVIEGTGTAQVERLPETMRFQIAVLSKATNAKAAIAGLKQRVENARKKVIALGAREGSIKVEPIVVDNTLQERLRAMHALQQRNGIKSDAKPALPMPVLVSCVLMADFPLSSKKQEALIVEVKALQDSIEAAKLSGKEAAKELTPAEKEVQNLDQNGDAGWDMTNSSSEPGAPLYAFVIRISDEEQAKVLSTAFQKAQADARSFAKAAGVEPGEMKSVTREINRGDLANTVASYETTSGPMASLSRAAIDFSPDSAEVREAVIAASTPVKYSVTVKVGYELKRTTQ